MPVLDVGLVIIFVRQSSPPAPPILCKYHNRPVTDIPILQILNIVISTRRFIEMYCCQSVDITLLFSTYKERESIDNNLLNVRLYQYSFVVYNYDNYV